MTANNSLYWIHDEDDSDPFNQGYIGITCRPQFRFQAHHILDEHVGAVTTILCHSLGREQALELERSYRPKPYIGWNVAPGGGGGVPDVFRKNRRVGAPRSMECRRKISAIHKDKPKSESHRQSISKTSRSSEIGVRQKISTTLKSKPPKEPFPCETCGKMVKNIGPHRKACLAFA